jgi:hypothetical protein
MKIHLNKIRLLTSLAPIKLQTAILVNIMIVIKLLFLLKSIAPHIAGIVRKHALRHLCGRTKLIVHH